MSDSPFQDIYNEVNGTRQDINDLANLVSDELANLKASVDVVNQEVMGVKDDVYSFKVRFEEFVEDIEKKNNITHAQGQIVILNQELKKRFGLYEEVRNNLLGILQAVDSGIVSKQVITNSTEELMLKTPRYWLSPSLIAISAWLNNNQQLAYKALSEGLKRDLLKTELIFTLINNRLKRQGASFAWLSKYFENQNPLKMPQATLILVNAYTDGVFGPDSHGECMKQISKWLDYLSQQPETIKDLESKWIKKIQVMPSESVDNISYNYMEQYCEEFPKLMNLLNYARKNQAFLNYLNIIINTTRVKKNYTDDLDDILFKLINEYDTDEFELRKKQKMCELILKYEGNKKKAKDDFEANAITMFKEEVTFYDILINAVTQEDISPNLRKLSMLLMKECIINAHRDFTATYRIQCPGQITIKLDNWSHKSEDGSNEKQMCTSYKQYLDKALQKQLDAMHPSYWLIGIACACFFWLIAAFNGISITFFVISLILVGLNILSVYNKKIELKETYKQKKYNGTSIIKGLCAEYVDWQKAYKNADSIAEKIPKLLNQYKSEDFTSNSAAKKILLN